MCRFGRFGDNTTGGIATFVVAASDTDAKSKARADYACDGIDDDVQINAAITALPIIGGRVVLLSGKFKIGATINLRPMVTLEGIQLGADASDSADSFGTAIILQDNVDSSMLIFNQTNAASYGARGFVRIKHLQLDGNSGNQSSGHGLHFYSTGGGVAMMDCVFEDVYVRNCKQNGFHIVGNGTVHAWGCYFYNCLSETNLGMGFYGELKQCYLNSCFFAYNGEEGIKLNVSTITTLTNIHSYLNVKHGFYIYACNDSILSGCISRDNASANGANHNYWIRGNDRVIVSNCISTDTPHKTTHGFLLDNTTGIVNNNQSYGSAHGCAVVNYSANRFDDLRMYGNVFLGRTSNTTDGACDTRLINKTHTIVDGDATPDVEAGIGGINVFVTSSNTAPTEITDLDNPVPNQIIILVGGSNSNSSTITDSGNFALSAGWTAGLNKTLTLWVRADNDYVELGRADN